MEETVATYIAYGLIILLFGWFFGAVFLERIRTGRLSRISEIRFVPNNLTLKQVSKSEFSTLLTSCTYYDKMILRPKDQLYFICGKRSEWEGLFLRSSHGKGLVTRPIDFTKWTKPMDYPIEDVIVFSSTGYVHLYYMITFGSIKDESEENELLKRVFSISKIKGFLDRADTSAWISESPNVLVEDFKKCSEMYRGIGITNVAVVLKKVGKHVGIYPIPITVNDRFYEVIMRIDFNTKKK